MTPAAVSTAKARAPLAARQPVGDAARAVAAGARLAAVVVVDADERFAFRRGADRRGPSTGRSRAPARDGSRALRPASAEPPSPRRSSVRILLPTPFIRVTRRPASGLGARESVRSVRAGGGAPPCRWRARRAAPARAAIRRRRSARPAPPRAGAPPALGGGGARRGWRVGASGPWRKATRPMQRQPRWALTRWTITAAACCASSANAGSTRSTSVAGATEFGSWRAPRGGHWICAGWA